MSQVTKRSPLETRQLVSFPDSPHGSQINVKKLRVYGSGVLSNISFHEISAQQNLRRKDQKISYFIFHSNPFCRFLGTFWISFRWLTHSSIFGNVTEDFLWVFTASGSVWISHRQSKRTKCRIMEIRGRNVSNVGESSFRSNLTSLLELGKDPDHNSRDLGRTFHNSFPLSL
jgi:hypothetical protein